MKTIIFFSVSAILGAIKLSFLPNIDMLGWAFAAIAIDFVTGVLKSSMNKVALTSMGFRGTIKKLIQYVGIIVLGTLLGNALPKDNELVLWINNVVLVFIIYTEAFSIVENLRDINPDSPMTKKIFIPLLSLLTLGIDKISNFKKSDEENKNNKPYGGADVWLLLITSGLLFNACTIVKPGETSTYSKTDTTETKYKPIFVEYKGGTSTTAINYDSLYAAWKKSLPATQQSNADSLFKVFLKSLKKDTVTVNDPQSKAQLKYWYDEFGKLQMSCTAKDQTLSIMVAEITRLTKEVSNSNKTVVVYKMVWWGWLIIGAALLALLGLLAVVFYFSWLHKKGKW